MNHFSPNLLTRFALATLGLSLLAHGAEVRAQCTTITTDAYWESYGVGCGALPTLAPSADPELNTVIQLVTSGQPASTFLTLTLLSLVPNVIGNPAGLPVPCLRFVGPAPEFLLSFPVLGTSTAPIAIPNDDDLIGIVVFAQSGALKSSGTWVDVSDAVCLHIGN